MNSVGTKTSIVATKPKKNYKKNVATSKIMSRHNESLKIKTVTPQTQGSIENPSTRGIHVSIECLNATNEYLSTRDSNMSKIGHVGPIHPYSTKYNQLYYNSFKS